MSTEPLPPIPANIAQLTGPVLLGNFFNWGLLGVLSVQTYIYYLGFPNDRRLPKFLVTLVYTIEFLQTVLVTRDAFRIFGPGWGNMIDLNFVAWIWFSIPIMTSIISCVVQLFFGWRIYILSQTWWLSSIVAFLSLVQMVAGVWSGINANIIGLLSELQDRNYKQTSVWLGGTALVDVVITISMIYYLYRSRTGFRATNALVTKFIRVTVETGLLCATFAVLDLSFFLAYKNLNYHLAPAIALSKLYSNSLLVLLNARVRIVGGRNVGPAAGDNTLAVTASTSSANGQTQSVHQFSRPKPPLSNKGINVAVTYETTYDVPMVDVAKFRRDSFSHDRRPHEESFVDVSSGV